MAYKSKLRFNKNFNITSVVKRVVSTILALYVGGSILTEFGTAMTNTSSGFYSGLTLIGWTVGNQITNGTEAVYYTCSGGGVQSLASPVSTVTGNCLTATTTGGVLTVVGIIAIAQIVTEFISW